jgi:hypothetical protein
MALDTAIELRDDIFSNTILSLIVYVISIMLCDCIYFRPLIYFITQTKHLGVFFLMRCADLYVQQYFELRYLSTCSIIFFTVWYHEVRVKPNFLTLLFLF